MNLKLCVLFLFFVSCKDEPKKEVFIKLEFKPTLLIPYSLFEIRSNGVEAIVHSKIFTAKHPLVSSVRDTIWHEQSIKILSNDIELLLNEIQKTDFKSHKTKELDDMLDGIGVELKFKPMINNDTSGFKSRVPYRYFNPIEADVLKRFFKMKNSFAKDSITLKYLTKLDSLYFGKYIQ